MRCSRGGIHMSDSRGQQLWRGSRPVATTCADPHFYRGATLAKSLSPLTRQSNYSGALRQQSPAAFLLGRASTARAMRAGERSSSSAAARSRCLPAAGRSGNPPDRPAGCRLLWRGRHAERRTVNDKRDRGALCSFVWNASFTSTASGGHPSPRPSPALPARGKGASRHLPSGTVPVRKAFADNPLASAARVAACAGSRPCRRAPE